MPAAVASQWRDRQRRVFQSVFPTDVAQPTPQSTPSTLFPGPGHPFGGHAASLTGQQQQQQQYHGQSHGHPPGEQQHPLFRRAPEPLLQTAPAQPLFPPAAADDQAAYDRAWHVVTAHIALPPSATADDSFGTTTTTLAPESQQQQQQSSSGRRRDRAATTGASSSNLGSSEFHVAFALLANASALLPHATRTGDVLAWHARQVRAHFAQHVIPLLGGCVDDDGDGVESEEDSEVEEQGRGRWQAGRKGNYYERHMVIVMSSIRTLEAALRLYFYGLNQLLSGFARLADVAPGAAMDGELLNARFRRDLHALVSGSVSEGLIRSVKAVLVRLAGTILGIPSHDEHRGLAARPAPPGPDDLKVQAARERLIELVQQLHNVGLAGERFQALFAEVMDAMMSDFVIGAYAGLWSAPDTRSFSATMDTVSRGASLSVASPCIVSLNDWVENHFARLSFEVLACISASPQGPLPVSLADLKTYQSLALGRLAALRIQELFDIVLAWPASRPALDDLRATITTAARRKQLTNSFSRALQTRLLHPGCSTPEILQTYISIIRTLHALDPSKVLLSRVEPGLRLYLCQREDAVHVVVAGLLASPEEMRAARKVKEVWKRQREKSRQDEASHGKHRRRDPNPFTTPGSSSTRTPQPRGTLRDVTPETETTPSHTATPSKDTRRAAATKLVELALLLTNDPSSQPPTRRGTSAATSSSADHDPDHLDWNDMTWLPDPIDAAAGYKRPRSEDVIGTLLSALGSGSGDVFIKEFAAVLAERLLLVRGEPAARFEQELRVLELLKRRFGEASMQACDVMIRDVVDSRRVDGVVSRRGKAAAAVTQTHDGGEEGMEYHARILSRLFWPGLEREHFLLPGVVVEQQGRYEAGYEGLKSRRKLTWLNQLGQARVEIELSDRTVTVDCSPVEATVVYAFQGGGDEAGEGDGAVQKSVEELYEQLQMDEDLITAALQFWVGKGVLRRVANNSNTYMVAETLTESSDTATTATGTDQPMDAEPEPEPPAASAAAAAAAAGAKQGVLLSAKERERRDMYWRYIQGMLTNASASMPLAQVAMMMKMLITDGFPWSNEELQDFLGEKVAEGEMEVVGGKYRLVRK
jgi:anaphase-promoting complex subunit 2